VRVRQLGARDLGEVKHLLYETKGNLTPGEEGAGASGSELIRAGLRLAAGYDRGKEAAE
jgi:hypothetical protein